MILIYDKTVKVNTMPPRVKQKSARSLSPLKPFVPDKSQYFLAIKLSDIDPETIEASGCPLPAVAGDSFLPSCIGKYSSLNAHGKEEMDKSSEKETVYRMVNRSWNDWHGYSHSGVSAVGYKRWPRIWNAPYEEHFRILEMAKR